MMDISDIRNRAQGVKPGAVQPHEVDIARRILKDGDGDVSAALYIVGYCGEAYDAPLLERYLGAEYAGVYGELALRALCLYLDLMPNYRATVRDFIIKGDQSDNRRLSAIQLLPEYLDGHKDNIVGRKVIEIMLSESDPARLAARWSLIRHFRLESHLDNPFALEFDNTDADTERLLAEGRRQFYD